MRFKTRIILPFIIFSTTLFSQKGLELGIGTGILIDQFKILDGGQHIRPQVDDSNSFSLLARKGISKNLGVEIGLTYKYLKGDYFNRAFLSSYRHFIIPIKINGKFELSKKNKISLIPSLGAFYLTNSLGTNSFASDGFEHQLNWGLGNPTYSYSLNYLVQVRLILMCISL